MRFNRRLRPIKAISFDLDDTLYSNRAVMVSTDVAMTKYFNELLQANNPETEFNAKFWFTYRTLVLKHTPELVHDVTEIRRVVYQTGLRDLGYSEAESKVEADKAMAHFLFHRNKVNVADEIHVFLSALTKLMPVVAISNGNVDTQVIGLDKYFKHIYHAGKGSKQKPSPDMYQQAFADLSIESHQLLHVGDCGYADIKGALRAGCQSAWLNCYDVGKPITNLADIELDQVTDLLKLFN